MLFNRQSKTVSFAAIQIMLIKNRLLKVYFAFASLNFLKVDFFIKIYLFFAPLFFKKWIYSINDNSIRRI